MTVGTIWRAPSSKPAVNSIVTGMMRPSSVPKANRLPVPTARAMEVMWTLAKPGGRSWVMGAPECALKKRIW